MIRFTSIAALLALTLATPALAQQSQQSQIQLASHSVSSCRAMFLSADLNGDGVLSGRELVAANLGDAEDGGVTMAEFMEECLDGD